MEQTKKDYESLWKNHKKFLQSMIDFANYKQENGTEDEDTEVEKRTMNALLRMMDKNEKD